jgi:SNF2 family DNA or RNA helicase
MRCFSTALLDSSESFAIQSHQSPALGRHPNLLLITMRLTDFIKNLFNPEHIEESSRLAIDVEATDLHLYLPSEIYNQAAQGHADSLTLHQYLRMQMLLEEGLAQPKAHGITLAGADAAGLDADTRFIFGLPGRWPGKLQLLVQGVSRRPDFSVQLHLHSSDGEVIRHYDWDGVFLRLSATERYLVDPPQWRAFNAVAHWQALATRTEYDNLAAIHTLIQAAADGLDIDTAAFKEFNTCAPQTVGLAIEVQANGDLNLLPAFGEGLSLDAVQARLGQLQPDGGAHSLRVGKTIILLDEERLKAAHEIIRKRHIPASQRRKFFAAPGSYLDAALVNLDAGFSVRVKGAGPFFHAYFGETDANDINWFDQRQDDMALALLSELADESQALLPPADLSKIIKDSAVLGDFKRKLADAEQTNATVLRLDDWRIDISDNARVYAALDDLEQALEKAPLPEDDTVALDIHLNDMESEFGSEINAPAKGFQSQSEIDFSAYTRTPFPHQVEGVRWMLGLALNEGQPLGEEHRIQGGLLADDMGLGKTYMSIVGIREILLQRNSDKPVLVVAPLSLLENWKREIQATYKEPFFQRIVVLQSDGDLDKFRLAGRSVETKRRMPAVTTLEGALFKLEDGDTQVNLEEGHEGLRAAPAPVADDLPPWEVSATNVPPVARTEVAAPTTMEKQPPAPKFAPPLHALAEEDDLFSLQQSLKIGPEWGPDRLDLPGTLVLATYQSLRDYQFSLAAIPWSVAVFDEAQNIKSPNTLQTRAAKALNAEFKLLVTGTPVENHLGELWCLFDTMQPGFLGSYQDFRQEYIKPILRATPEELDPVREEIGKQLRERVGGFMLRRIKEDHLPNMPRKHIILGECDDNGRWTFDPRISMEMHGGQRLRYEDVMSDVVSAIQAGEATSAALRGLQQLRDVSLHPGLIDELPPLPRTSEEARAVFERSGKLQVVLRVLEEARGRGEKVLIFVVNKRLQELTAVALRRLYGLPIAIINGETKAVSHNPNNPTRQGIIDRFQATEGFNVLVISPVAAGVGLTITAANHVIHLERHWNPAKEAQATDRAYRIGQTKEVFVYIPILTHPEFDSFDVNLNRLLSSKTSLKDAIITQEEVRAGELVQSGVFATASLKASDE